MPKAHSLRTDVLQDYVDRLPPSQRRHPAVLMLQDILGEAYASGYPERIELVNRANCITAGTGTAAHEN